VRWVAAAAAEHMHTSASCWLATHPGPPSCIALHPRSYKAAKTRGWGPCLWFAS
jgi:hypothetical protein